MTLQQLIEKLEKLKSKHGENANIEFITEAADWGFEEDAVAHEIDQTHDWDDVKNQKWINIYLK
jgi:hypothetical protein